MNGSNTKLVLVSLVVIDTDLFLVELTPNPRLDVAVKAVVEFDGAMYLQPVTPVVQFCPPRKELEGVCVADIESPLPTGIENVGQTVSILLILIVALVIGLLLVFTAVTVMVSIVGKAILITVFVEGTV